MIKRFLSTLIILSFMAAAKAVPMYPYPVKLYQPDGTVITVVGHGDEFRKFMTTQDGYTIVRGSDGYFRYAERKGGKLVAADIVAHEPETRLASEKAYLRGVERFLAPELSTNLVPLNVMTPAPARSVVQKPIDGGSSPLVRPNFNLKDFRGLLILANYRDCKFRMGDEGIKEVYEGLMNAADYTGYNDSKDGFQRCTGSVRDYFHDNTYGAFAPQFDIVVVDIDYSMYDMGGTANTIAITTAAARAAAAKGVDFSKYDGGQTSLAVALTGGNALISDDAVMGSEPATSVTVEMESGKWADYSLTLTGNGRQNLRFRGASGPVKRFFLDEVLLTEKISTGIMAAPSVPADTADGAAYNLSGQRVGKDWRGIRIVGGKKIVKQ